MKTTSQYAQTHDYEHTYDGMGNREGVCRIRIYENLSLAPIVLCSALAKNDGTSITNLIEYIAAEVLTRFFRDRLESGDEPVIWIEYYPLQESPFEHLLRVTFTRYTAQCYGSCYAPQSTRCFWGAMSVIERYVGVLSDEEVPRMTRVGTSCRYRERSYEQRCGQSGENRIKCCVFSENRHFPSSDDLWDDEEIACEWRMRLPDCGW